MRKCCFLILILGFSHATFAQTDALVVSLVDFPGASTTTAFTDGDSQASQIARYDANGDNVADLVFQRDDAQGNPISLRVFDGSSRALIWNVSDLSATLGPDSPHSFWGFVNPFNDGQTYAAFVDGADFLVWEIVGNSPVWSWREANPNSQNQDEAIRFLGRISVQSKDQFVIAALDTDVVQIWRAR